MQAPCRCACAKASHTTLIAFSRLREKQWSERLEIVEENLPPKGLSASRADEAIEPRHQLLLRLERSAAGTLELDESTEVRSQPTREPDHRRTSGHSTAASWRRG
jgi:hypothetical protein